jgi:hypothetical protein
LPSNAERLRISGTHTNIALVIVGIAGIAAAICTLRIIREQSDVMRGKLGEMQQARELSISKERARLFVDIKYGEDSFQL